MRKARMRGSSVCNGALGSGGSDEPVNVVDAVAAVEHHAAIRPLTATPSDKALGARRPRPDYIEGHGRPMSAHPRYLAEVGLDWGGGR